MSVERSVKVPGGRLHVVDSGTGPPVVLLHAGIVDARAWGPVADRLVAAGYRAVAYDRRGSGRSVADDVPFSHRDDTRAVMDALGIDRACLVGNSMGGQIAMERLEETGTPDEIAELDLRTWVDGPGQPPSRLPAAAPDLLVDAIVELLRPLPAWA